MWHNIVYIYQIRVQEDSEGEGLVAHFPAHTSEPISSMAFDPSGKLLCSDMTIRNVVCSINEYTKKTCNIFKVRINKSA